MDDPPAQMILLDAGLVNELGPVDRRNFLDLFTAVAVGDGRRAAQLMIERSRNAASVIDPEGFITQMDELIGQVQQKTFRVRLHSPGLARSFDRALTQGTRKACGLRARPPLVGHGADRRRAEAGHAAGAHAPRAHREQLYEPRYGHRRARGPRPSAGPKPRHLPDRPPDPAPRPLGLPRPGAHVRPASVALAKKKHLNGRAADGGRRLSARAPCARLRYLIQIRESVRWVWGKLWGQDVGARPFFLLS